MRGDRTASGRVAESSPMRRVDSPQGSTTFVDPCVGQDRARCRTRPAVLPSAVERSDTPIMPGVACASHRGRLLSVVLATTTGPTAALPDGPQEESPPRPGPAVRGCRDHTRTSAPAPRRRWPGRSTGPGSTAGRRTASSIRQPTRCRRLSSQARARLRGRTRLSRGSPGAVRGLRSALLHPRVTARWRRGRCSRCSSRRRTGGWVRRGCRVPPRSCR